MCVSGGYEGEGSGAGSEQKERHIAGDPFSGDIISSTTAGTAVWRYAPLPQSRSVRMRLGEGALTNAANSIYLHFYNMYILLTITLLWY